MFNMLEFLIHTLLDLYNAPYRVLRPTEDGAAGSFRSWERSCVTGILTPGQRYWCSGLPNCKSRTPGDEGEDDYCVKLESLGGGRRSEKKGLQIQ